MKMEPAAEIRSIDPDSLDRIAKLEGKIFGPEAWSKFQIAQELRSKWGDYREVHFGGRVVAYGGIKGELEGDLMTLAVEPPYRRQGFAEYLLQDLLNRAAERGMKKIFLEVRVSNVSAIALYRKFGFVSLGTVSDYYRDPVEDAMSMVIEMRKNEEKHS